MSDIYIKKVYEFCKTNGFNEPKFQTKQIEGQFITTIIIKVGSNGVQEENISGIGPSEDNSMETAINRFFEETAPKLEALKSAPELPQMMNNLSVNNRQMHSSEHINDEVSDIPNTIGYLQEVCTKKGYSSPIYDVISRTGEDHSPLFVFRCTININGVELFGMGKGCPKQEAKKRSAQDLIRKLKGINGNVRSADINCVVKPDIDSYLITKFQDMKNTVNQIIVEIGDNYCQKLEKIAEALDCRLEYLPFIDNPIHITLKMIVKNCEYPLITTFGNSTERLDVSRNIAAKKAILIIKILSTEDQN